ncbi:MAG: hypothetical protein ACFFE2_03550 [Candidatus Thorarchaeota archaeon]
MDSLKQILSLMIISLILASIPLGTSNISMNPQRTMQNIDGATPSVIDITQVIPDPELDTEPEAFVNGSSGEFSFSYSPGTMLLNCTHDSATNLEVGHDDDETYPAYFDNVYFTQSFDWPYEEMPEDAVMHLNYSASLSGGFTDTEVASMFNVYTWFIDSSGNWYRLYKSSTIYDSGFNERQINLNYFDLLEGFGGMVEDSFGVQEDPSDTLTVGIGLAPTPEFNNSINDGSAVIHVASITLQVIMQAEPDPASHLTPLYNETFGTTISDIFPRFAGNTTPVGDNLKAMTTDSDGNIYLTGFISSPYEFYIENHVMGSFQFLIKYNPTLDRKWLVRNDNMTRAYAIAYHEGNIFTTGSFWGYEIPEYANLMLTKWTPTGQKVWEKEWGGDHDQIGVALDVHQDGSIYVLAADHNIRGPEPAYQNSSLLKFDSSGNVLWNKPLPLCTMFDIPGKLWVFESHIIYFMSGILMCMDLEGNVLWDASSDAATCDESDNIYASDYSYGVPIYNYDFEGNQTWFAFYDIEYPNDWVEWLDVHDLALTQNDELLVLIQGWQFDESFRLLKYELNGTLLQVWSIGDDDWPWAHGARVHMEVTSTGLVYFTFGHISWDVWTQAYAIGDYTLPSIPPPLLPPMSIIAIGGGIAVIAVIVILVYNRKKI